MLNEAPKGWKTDKLSSISTIKGGKRLPKGESLSDNKTNHPYIRVTDFEKYSVNTNNIKYITDETYESIKNYTISSEDLYISIAGTTGIVGTVPKELDGANLTENAAKIIIRNPINIDKNYLKYYLNAPNVQQKIKQLTVGVGVPKLSLNRIGDINITYPKTLQEQQEIVQVLDTMSEIIRLRQECINSAQDLIPALFQEMFGDINNNKTNSPIVKLGDIAEFVRGPFGGSLKKEDFVKEGYLVYEQHHAINNDFNFARYYVDEQKYEKMKRFAVNAGDLLISCSGTMGKIAIVPEYFKKGIINQALLKLTVNKEILNNIFLKNLLLSDFYQNAYFRNQPGVAIQNVRSVKVLKNIDVILPPIDLQDQFAQKAIKIENYIKEQQAEQKNAEQMFQSLLYHAFTGDLRRRAYGEN